jgi:hypothetical protein
LYLSRHNHHADPFPTPTNRKQTSYSAGYPCKPLQLRLRDPEGLLPEDVTALLASITDSAAAYARQEAICVFNLVDECQEFLRARNAAAARRAEEEARASAAAEEQEVGSWLGATALLCCRFWTQRCRGGFHFSISTHRHDAQTHETPHPKTHAQTSSGAAPAQSLWHAMQLRQQQQREAAAATREDAEPSYSGAGGTGGGGGDDELWGFDAGGLFAEEGEHSFALPTIGDADTPQQAAAARAARRGQQQQAPAARGAGARPEASPEVGGKARALLPPLTPADLATSPVGPSFLGRGAAGRGAGGGAAAAAAGAAASGHPAGVLASVASSEGVATSSADEGKGGCGGRQRRQQLGAGGKWPLERSRSKTLSFSSLPVPLQQLLTSTGGLQGSGGGGGKPKKAAKAGDRAQAKQQQQQPEQQPEQQGEDGMDTPLAFGSYAPLAFGDFSVGGDAASSSSSSGSGSGSSSSSESDSEAEAAGRTAMGSAEEDEGEEERVSLRLQLLLGHLLTLAASGGPASPLPPQSIPVVAGALRRAGLLPRWVHWLLTHQQQQAAAAAGAQDGAHAAANALAAAAAGASGSGGTGYELFDRAFRRLFAAEIQEAARPEALPRPPPAQALQRFWDRSALAAAAAASSAGAPPAPSQQPSQQQQQQPQQQPPAPPTPPALASRYRSDFQELHKLGRGGFGVVVAAINRLDGRQYAVKKIKLQPGGTAGSYSRILREVAALSRLQHPNVVRYFQVGGRGGFLGHACACGMHAGTCDMHAEADVSMHAQKPAIHPRCIQRRPGQRLPRELIWRTTTRTTTRTTSGDPAATRDLTKTRRRRRDPPPRRQLSPTAPARARRA